MCHSETGILRVDASLLRFAFLVRLAYTYFSDNIAEYITMSDDTQQATFLPALFLLSLDNKSERGTTARAFLTHLSFDNHEAVHTSLLDKLQQCPERIRCITDDHSRKIWRSLVQSFCDSQIKGLICSQSYKSLMSNLQCQP